MTTLDPFEPVQYPVTEEEIAQVQAIFKESGKVISEAEAEIETIKLRQLADMAMEMYFQQEEWNQKLEKEPRDFFLKGEGRSCSFCHSIESDMGYDSYGLEVHCLPRCVQQENYSEKYL